MGHLVASVLCLVLSLSFGNARHVPDQQTISDPIAIEAIGDQDEVLSGLTKASIASALLMGEALSDSLSNFIDKSPYSNNIDDGVPIMAEKAGYPCETHYVTTDDGYILQMHRIPHGKNEVETSNGTEKPVLFLQHGLLSSSSDWVLAGPNRSLGFIAADRGYDVWLGNYRGNSYSRAHIHLDPSEFEFWDFSFDQMADHDLPKMLGYVLNHTKQEKIFYAGHSMGTTTFMIMSNLHPEIQDHIILANFLAPVAYVEHLKGPLRLLAPIVPEVLAVLNSLKIGELLPNNALMDWISDKTCKDKDIFQPICSTIIFMIAGWDIPQLDTSMIDQIATHTPAGASSHTVAQYGQMINSANLQAFDFGKKKNEEVYGTPDPPVYDVKKVTAPVVTYWGDNDWLAQPPDVLRLTAQLPNLVESYEVPFNGWNHLDFVYGIDANTLVYPELFKNMEKLNPSFVPKVVYS